MTIHFLKYHWQKDGITFDILRKSDTDEKLLYFIKASNRTDELLRDWEQVLEMQK